MLKKWACAMDFHDSVRRRRLLRPAAGFGVASPNDLRSTTADKRALSLDPDNTADRALIFRKLAYAADDRMGFWWLNGCRYGLIDTKLVPLWNIHIGNIFAVRDLLDDTYEVTVTAFTFYTDLKSGEYLQRFVNPLNRKTVEVAYYPWRPFTITYDVAGVGRAVGGGNGNTIGPAWIQGDDVWVQSDHFADIAPLSPSGGRPNRINDLVTYFGSLKGVANPAIKMPAGGYLYTDINSWPAWLGMEDRPGDYYARCYGRKVSSYADMPDVWRRLMMQEYPAIATDPAAALRR